jgi:hypothetical protein
MVLIDDVKQISHEVVESHNRRGYSLVKLTPTETQSVGVLVNVTKEPLVVEGPELKAKADVRKFLWENRNGAKLRRKDRTWIWTRFLKDQGVSVVGLATMTKKEVAEKLSAKDPEYQWIEVGT